MLYHLQSLYKTVYNIFISEPHGRIDLLLLNALPPLNKVLLLLLLLSLLLLLLRTPLLPKIS